MESGILAEPVLVGRERELEKLHDFLELAVHGKGAAVFVSGEAGSGKTRLISEFLKDTKQKTEITKLTGWCLSNAGIPYFPFIEAFGTYFSSSGKKSKKEESELNFWLKEPSRSGLSGEFAYLSPQVLKDQTFAAVTKALLSISATKPTILFIDDIHWADSASLALLHYISRSIASKRVLVIATYRSEELNVTREGYPHPLVETLRLMGRENLFKEIKLENLSPDDVQFLAETMVEGRLQPKFAEKLVNESNGSPLFVVESVRMLIEKGNLVQKNGLWNLAVEEIEIPAKVKDIILRRVAALKPEERKLLDLASVLGSKFAPEMLSAVLERGIVEVLETLDDVAQCSSLLVCEGSVYRFDHTKSRDAVYSEISLALRRAYHSLVAEKLETMGKEARLSVSDLAYHYAQAGNKEKAVKYALASGQDALAKWSNLQAIQHFTYVLQNVSAEEVIEKRTASEGLGDAYAANYMYAEAIKTFDQLASSEGGVVQLRAIRKAMDAAFLKGDKPDLLLEYARKAEELAVYDRLEMARVLENRGRAFGWAGRGDYRMDLSDYETALRMFEEENSLPDVAEALGRHGEAAMSAVDLREKALGELLRSIAIFKELGDARKEVEATLRAGFAFSFGLFPEARRLLVTVLSAGQKLGMFVELARAHGILGLLDERERRFEEALSQVFKALEYYKMTDVIYVQGLDLAALTRIYCKLGDVEHADEYFDRMTDLPPEVLATGLAGLMILSSKGVYFAAKGRWEESNHAFEKQAKLGWRVFEDYAWALEKQGRFEEAKAQRDGAQIFQKQIEKQFEHANVQLSIMMPRKIKLGSEFEIRLDIVNVARNPGKLVKVEGLLPSGSKVVSLPTFCAVKDNSIEMKKKSIGPFQTETIKLRQAILKEGTYTFSPILFFLDDLGEIKTSKTQPITVTVELASSRKLESVAEPVRFEFESEAAEKAFNFLVSAFKEDYRDRKLPKEKSGWRSLMEIVRKGGVTMNSMYGRSGRGGKAALELERHGLVESRFFRGERGRGGNVFKLRIRFENETVNQLIGCG